MVDSVLVQLGGGGGDITLFGRRENGQWEFRRSMSDSSWAMIDEELDSDTQPVPEPTWVKTWSEAIALLDRNPCAKLVPISVHADFREEVLCEVARRLLVEPSGQSERQMERWLQICAGQTT
jgi:hypothetical protein